MEIINLENLQQKELMFSAFFGAMHQATWRDWFYETGRDAAKDGSRL
jgi:hypothetical protein